MMNDRMIRLKRFFRLNNNQILFYNNRICVPKKNVPDTLKLAHDDKTSGHFGYAKTLSRLGSYHWKNIGTDVYDYCKGCGICQLNKDGHVKPLGDAQPLELPTRRWGSIALDFVTHLSLTKSGFDCITTYVDRYSKIIHLIPSRGTDSSIDAAEGFFHNIFRLHGLPDSILSDRDPKFTSKFWSHFMPLCGMQLKMSTTRHPQTDGATEIMNMTVGNYLPCYCAYHQRDWDALLTSEEFAYNSAKFESMGTTPFEADLGWQPRSPIEISSSRHDDSFQTVNAFQAKLDESFRNATFAQRLVQAREAAYNSKRYTPPNHEVRNEVYLTRKLFTDATSTARLSPKLFIRRVGPFKIL